MIFNKKIKKRSIIQPASHPAILGKKRCEDGGRFGIIFRKIIISISLASFLGVVFYALFFSGYLQITSITVKGAENLDADLIKNFTFGKISGKYFDTLEKNNIMLISSDKISRSIADKFRRIEDISLEKKFPDTLEVAIKERRSMMVLCSAGICFIIDDKGFPYAGADFESDDLKENELFVLNDDGNRAVKIGEKALDPDYIQYLLDIKDRLKGDLDLEIEKDYRTPKLISGDIRVKTSEGWMIYVDVAIPIQKEIEMLKLVLAEKIEKEKRTELEYVDLRTDNKVYYKFKTPEQKPAPELKDSERK